MCNSSITQDFDTEHFEEEGAVSSGRGGRVGRVKMSLYDEPAFKSVLSSRHFYSHSACTLRAIGSPPPPVSTWNTTQLGQDPRVFQEFQLFSQHQPCMIPQSIFFAYGTILPKNGGSFFFNKNPAQVFALTHLTLGVEHL